MKAQSYAKRGITISLVLTVVILGSAECARAQLLGSSFADGKLYDINPTTGAATNPRNLGFGWALAFSPTGILYGVTQIGGSPTGNALYVVNATNGMATMVSTLNPAGISVEGDIAFDPTSGILYGVNGGASGFLFTINTSNGLTTPVGKVPGAKDKSAMAFDASGNLWVVDTWTGKLLRVNKSTAAVISSVSLNPAPGGAVAGLSFDPCSGVAYFASGLGLGTTNSLYTVNTTSGVMTLVGALSGTSGVGTLAQPPCRASISGFKFNDLDGNGVRDTGEPGLANWTIKITSSSGTTEITTTDLQGNYSFTLPAPGTYAVSEVLQSGWMQTAPTSGIYAVAVSGYQVVNKLDFGNKTTNGPGACATPPPGMVAWWPLDEASGATVVNDIAGFNNQGVPKPGGQVPTGGPTPTVGEVNGALYFFGPYVEVAPQAELDFGSGDFSIDGWVRPVDCSHGGGGVRSPIVDKFNGTTGFSFYLDQPTFGVANLYVNINGSTFVSSGTIPTLGSDTWSHVAVTVTRPLIGTAVGTFYVNGVAAGTFTPPTGSVTNTLPMWIGKTRIAGGSCEIAIDELELFNLALQPEEVRSIADAKSAGKCRATGSLNVTKSVKNLWAAPSPAGTNFPITVSCLPTGPNLTLNLAAGGTQTVNNIPVGSICTVTEGVLPAPIADPACASLGWDTTTYAPGQNVTIPSTGGSQTVTVTNTYFCNTGSACASLPANMVSWWPLNEQEGATVVTDIKGGHNGTPSGSLVGWDALAAKVGGRALSVGDNVSVPDDQSLRFGTGNFSVDAWFAIGEPKFIGGIVDKLDTTAKKGYALYVQNDHLKLVMGDGTALVTYTSAAPVGIVFGVMAWHHVAVTVDRSGGLSTFYVDGKSAGTFFALPSNRNIATTSPLLIGGSRQTFSTNTCVCEYFLDEVEIFNDVLSASDIKAIYDAGSAGKCTAGIHGKKFNDLNQNKVIDPGEPGLRGWTIQVKDQGGNTQSTTTDAQGNYSFSVPAPGTFTLSEVKQDGWFPTTSPRTITVAANESVNVNFGNFDVRRREFLFTRGMNEFCIWGGGGPFNSPMQIDNPNPQTPIRNTGGVRYGTIGLCYGRILWANDRFAFKYTFNAIPVAVLSYQDVNPDLGFPVPGSATRRNVFGAGLSPIGAQLYFRPQSRIKPFVSTSGGFIFFQDPVPRLNGAQFNFTYDFGGGVQVFRDSRRAFTFGYKYQRISNGGRALKNPGFDGHVFYFGYSIFKARKIAPGP